MLSHLQDEIAQAGRALKGSPDAARDTKIETLVCNDREYSALPEDEQKLYIQLAKLISRDPLYQQRERALKQAVEKSDRFDKIVEARLVKTNAISEPDARQQFELHAEVTAHYLPLLEQMDTVIKESNTDTDIDINMETLSGILQRTAPSQTEYEQAHRAPMVAKPAESQSKQK